MFSTNNNILVTIKYAQLLTGKFDWIEGEYRPVTWGSDQVMLKFEFAGLDSRMNFFVLTNNGSTDYQHTTKNSQRSFFLPIKELPSLQQLQIIGMNVSDNGSAHSTTTQLGKSISIADAVSITDKIVSMISFNAGMSYLQQGKIKLEQFLDKSDEQICSQLLSQRFALKNQTASGLKK